jgi:peptide deformylase
MPSSHELPVNATSARFTRDLVIFPDPRLRQVCEPINPAEFNSEALYSQAGQMLLALWKYKAIGIAANQLGYDNQMICVVPHPAKSRDRHGYPIIMCNPHVIYGTLQQTMPEGCLSFPETRALRKRSARITVAYYTLDGAMITMKADGLFAQCIQHEYDHLNGKVFTDPME